MKEYVFACMIGGKEIWLQILGNSSGIYQVFWDAVLIGTVELKIDDNIGMKWHTHNDILKPHVDQIGNYIMRCDS